MQKYRTYCIFEIKNGIKAPMSGSIALNGQSMAEQIGAEIFIDTWAMVNPGNLSVPAKWPEKQQV